MVNKQTEEVNRILRMAEYVGQRIVVNADREAVIALFVHLAKSEPNREKERSVREIARAMDLIFDFRTLKSPEQSLGLQSLETVIFTYLKEKSEKEYGVD